MQPETVSVPSGTITLGCIPIRSRCTFSQCPPSSPPSPSSPSSSSTTSSRTVSHHNHCNGHHEHANYASFTCEIEASTLFCAVAAPWHIPFRGLALWGDPFQEAIHRPRATRMFVCRFQQENRRFLGCSFSVDRRRAARISTQLALSGSSTECVRGQCEPAAALCPPPALERDFPHLTKFAPSDHQHLEPHLRHIR